MCLEIGAARADQISNFDRRQKKNYFSRHASTAKSHSRIPQPFGLTANVEHKKKLIGLFLLSCFRQTNGFLMKLTAQFFLLVVCGVPAKANVFALKISSNKLSA
jgi:hypothetical protein